MLGSLHSIVSHAIDSASAKYDNLIFELKRTCEIIDTNKASLDPSYLEEEAASEENADTEEEPTEENSTEANE